MSDPESLHPKVAEALKSYGRETAPSAQDLDALERRLFDSEPTPAKPKSRIPVLLGAGVLGMAGLLGGLIFALRSPPSSQWRGRGPTSPIIVLESEHLSAAEVAAHGRSLADAAAACGAGPRLSIETDRFGKIVHVDALGRSDAVGRCLQAQLGGLDFGDPARLAPGPGRVLVEIAPDPSTP